MATMAENVIAAGKDNGEMLKDSIDNGPYQFKPEITIKDTDGVTDIRCPQRIKDLDGQDKLCYDSDIKVVNILLLGLLVDIYTLINHYQTAKEIWDRVKELMEDTEMTKQENESMLYDKFDKFTSEPGESIYSYYLRYAKLINDMKMIPMSMSNMQINTKFMNHLQPEWSRFVTTAKQARNIHSVNFDKLYAFLKHNEKYAKEVREMRQRFPEPLALLANTYNPPPSYSSQQIQYQPQPYEVYQPTQATIQNDQVTVQNVQGRQSQGYAGNAGNNQASGARVINTVGNARANQLRVVTCYNCNGEGHIAKQCTVKKRVKDSEWFTDKMLLAQAQDAGVVLNEELQDFLADSLEETDNYYDNEATTNAIFMENLSPIGSLNDDTVEPRYDSDILSEVPHYENYHDSDMLNFNIQEVGYIENIISNNESYDELTSNSNVISYTDYMLNIGNDADNYVPPPVQKNDMMFLSFLRYFCFICHHDSSTVKKLTEPLNEPKREFRRLRRAALRSHQNDSLAIAGRNLFDDEASSSNNTEPKPSTPPKTLHEHSRPTSSGFQNPITVTTEQTGRIVDSRDIWLIQNTCTFQGLRIEDPLRHVKHYLSIVDNIQTDRATRDTSRLRFFHFSLKGKAEEWLDIIPLTQFMTWEQLVLRFLNHFFLVGRTSALRDLIIQFKQGDDEPIKSAWIRFQDLINQVPHHGIQKWLMVQIFHDNISQDDHRKLDQFTQFRFRSLTKEEGWIRIEEYVKYQDDL
ncbi:retrovirus-related pol polyprotein from transposon TNT 1-94 [Tanacetum coccineum]|uniref:Retrovirus-related pol polyprotein from transposon TNT 1-94 n=1 Tax=Tanacetum coccineum TaxID=301880 RepID=A0ABQ5AX08_9ASTR